jgi:MSHA pilin protein MshD
MFTKQRGISLIELIMFIVIISVALVGILLVMNQVTRHSADPLIRKQAMAIAESLLEEVELQDFIAESGVATASVTVANRSTAYHIVSDYNAFNMPSPPGIYSIADATAAVPGLASYSASVTVGAQENIGGASAVRITVTVTDPQNNAITIDGYKAAY